MHPPRLPTLFAAFLLTTAGISASVGLAGSAEAAVGQITGLGGKCLDVAAANSTNGTQVQVYGCNGTGAQSWNVGTDGTIRALGKCLDVAGGATADGTKIQIWDCVAGNGNQQWTYNATTKRLTNPKTGKCLDQAGGSTADGTKAQLWTCNTQTNQQWTLPTGGPTEPTPGKLNGSPYLYLGWGSPPSATSVMSSTGVRGYTMAFMLSGGGCVPRWDGGRPLTGGADASTISGIKNAGGQVQISFGGWSGNKLGPNCSSASAYAGAVQQVINAYQPTAVDFDIENTDEFENNTVMDRILGGLKIIKQNNPNTKVVVTFGTSTSGPTGQGIRLINQSRALGVGIDNYTIMPFDFGGGANMYQSTVNASEGLKNALKSAFGWTDAQAYAHMGISGMNGLSDQSEVTSTGTWTQIRDWARSHGLTRFAFWSVNRDRPCNGPLNETCSGVAQSNWQFTQITAGF